MSSNITSASGAMTNTAAQAGFVLFSALKRDGIVQLALRFIITGSAGANSNFSGLLPAGFRPFEDAMIHTRYNTTDQAFWFVFVRASGTVEFHKRRFTAADGLVSSNLDGNENEAHSLTYMAAQ